MKHVILSAGMLLAFGLITQAQSTQNKKTGTTNHVVHHNNTSNKSLSNGNVGNTVSLNHTDSNKAYAYPPFENNQLTIQDPTIRALNARANGEPVNISASGIVGMPRSAYGFRNGHLLLRNTGATSSGTTTGSGSVGTGTAPGSVGTFGSVIGVNGKTPNAGNSIWGTAITGPDPRLNDSLRFSGKKKQ